MASRLLLTQRLALAAEVNPTPFLLPNDDAKATAKRGPASKSQQQVDRITQLPGAGQQFVLQVIDSVLAQAAR